MYSYEDRMKAVQLYIQYDQNAAAVIRELGYPNRHSLVSWYKEYLNNNDLKKKRFRTTFGILDERKERSCSTRVMPTR